MGVDELLAGAGDWDVPDTWGAELAVLAEVDVGGTEDVFRC